MIIKSDIYKEKNFYNCMTNKGNAFIINYNESLKYNSYINSRTTL